jgi:hypothetical protein
MTGPGGIEFHPLAEIFPLLETHRIGRNRNDNHDASPPHADEPPLHDARRAIAGAAARRAMSCAGRPRARPQCRCRVASREMMFPKRF